MTLTDALEFLRAHDVVCLVQDGELWATDEFVQLQPDGTMSPLRCEWKRLRCTVGAIRDFLNY